jgi:hypothetical protein
VRFSAPKVSGREDGDNTASGQNRVYRESAWRCRATQGHNAREKLGTLRAPSSMARRGSFATSHATHLPVIPSRLQLRRLRSPIARALLLMPGAAGCSRATGSVATALRLVGAELAAR